MASEPASRPETMAQIIRSGQADGKFRTDADPEQVAFEIHGFVLAAHDLVEQGVPGRVHRGERGRDRHGSNDERRSLGHSATGT